MKILHVAPIGHIVEGIGNVIMKLAPLQRKLGQDVRIVSVMTNHVYDAEISTITNANEFQVYIGNWIPDIVIFHSVFFLPYLGFAKILREQKIPYLVQLHGGLSKENLKKGKLKKKIALLLGFKHFIRKAKSVIYLNPCEYRNSVAKVFNPNYTIVPNGCDQIGNVCFDRPCSEVVDMVYIGRIDMVHKGIDVLLEALKILSGRGCQKFKLFVYANPNDPDLPVFKKVIAGMSDIIEYWGPVYGKEKKERLQKADIFILTSRYDGMPMGVLEALSFGVPCILTPGTNMADEVAAAGAGWKTEFSAKSVAETIELAVKEMQQNQRKYHHAAHEFSKRFNWINIAKQYVQVLSSFRLYE